MLVTHQSTLQFIDDKITENFRSKHSIVFFWQDKHFF